MKETRFVIAQWDSSELTPYAPVETEEGGRFRAASFSTADEAYRHLHATSNPDRNSQALLICAAHADGDWLALI